MVFRATPAPNANADDLQDRRVPAVGGGNASGTRSAEEISGKKKKKRQKARKAASTRAEVQSDGERQGEAAVAAGVAISGKHDGAKTGTTDTVDVAVTTERSNASEPVSEKRKRVFPRPQTVQSLTPSPSLEAAVTRNPTLIQGAEGGGKICGDNPIEMNDVPTQVVVAASGGAKGNPEVADTRPRRKKRRGKGKEKKAAAAGRILGAAGSQQESGEQGLLRASNTRRITGQVPRPVEAAGAVSGVNGVTGAAGELGRAVELAAVVAEAGKNTSPQVLRKQKQQQQQHGAREDAAEDVTHAVISKAHAGGAKLTKNQKKKQENKKMKTQAGEQKTGEGDAVARARNLGWELDAEESARMLPWTYLGMEMHPALMWHLHRQVYFC